MLVVKELYRKFWSEESNCYTDSYFCQILAVAKGREKKQVFAVLFLVQT